MEYQARRILITGGAGFLGSHLCEQLLDAGHHVICIDNLTTGSSHHIDIFADNPRFKFIQHDVVTPLDVHSDFGPIDEIYNCACPASPLQYQKNPVQTLKTNVYGAANMLEYSRRLNARILQTSTSEVYGDPEVHPQVEKYVGHVNTLGIRACYEEGKRAAETLFIDYYRQYALRIKIARLFNVYGPRMQIDDGRVIPNFIHQALLDQPITIYGDGLQTRSFCYVTDTIRGLLSLMATGDDFIGPVNIGSTHEITIAELAETLIDIIGSKSSLIFKPKPQDDPVRRRPNIDLAREKLNWAPAIPFREGLQNTVAYFEQMLSAGELANAV
jgi:UDP-glucuronate decarboxylase